MLYMGRPSKRPRTAFGERLFAARTAAGLSQVEVAQKLGITQTAYALWERRPMALAPIRSRRSQKFSRLQLRNCSPATARSKERAGPVGRGPPRLRAGQQAAPLPTAAHPQGGGGVRGSDRCFRQVTRRKKPGNMASKGMFPGTFWAALTMFNEDSAREKSAGLSSSPTMAGACFCEFLVKNR